MIARKTLALLEQHLHEHAGLEIPDWIVQSRVLARMSALGLDAGAYVTLVTSRRGVAELDSLVEALRVGETRFFRHRPQVDAVLEVVVPSWGARGMKSPRVWSAGCASGEEAYTLALVLARAMPAPSFAPTVYATDVSADAIAVARRAVYGAAAMEQVPEPWRSGVVAEGTSTRVGPEAASLVTFEQRNLADPGQPRGFDLIWCRNVLIYFGPEAKRRVLGELVESLAPGGFLFLGYSETLRDVPGLSAHRFADQVLWEKTVGSAPSVQRPMKSELAFAPPIAVASPRPLGGSTKPRAVAGPAQRPKPDPVLRWVGADPATLASEIGQALRAPGIKKLTVDLDGAEFIGDDVAPVLRRATVAAEAQGVALEVRATRPGPQRWLRRNRLAGGEP